MARIAFVQNLSFEYLGVMYLSSVLKKAGHSVEVFIEHGQGDGKLVKEIMAFGPDLAGFPCTTGLHLWALDFSALLKNHLPKVKMIFGGPHPTFFPEIIDEPQVDIVCRGEAEYALLELSRRLDENKDYSDVLNLWVKKEGRIYKNEVRPLIENLDELPFPDRELYKKYPFLNKSQKAFIVGRGCPFLCAYCFNHASMKIYKGKGNFTRYRSPDNVIKEMVEVKDYAKIKTVYIQDDTFCLNKDWTRTFLKGYKEKVGLPFICLIRADSADEEDIKGLKAAGCLNAFFGVESGSERLRNLILKKNISDEQIVLTASLLKKYGIGFRTYNMLGLPQETLEDAFKTVELNIKIGTDFPWSSLFAPFPGTELGEYVSMNNLLEDGGCFEPSFFKKSGMKLENKREIENLHRLFFYAVKFPFLFPLVKKAIKRELSFFYNFLFLLGYLYSFKQSENLSFFEAAGVGLNNIKNFIFSKRAN